MRKKFIISWIAIPLPVTEDNIPVTYETWEGGIELGMYEATSRVEDEKGVAAMALNRLSEQYIDHILRVQAVEINVPWWRRLAAWWRERKSPPQQ